MDRYAYQVCNQFSNHVDYTIADDCLDNYTFLDDHNQCVSNTALSLSYDHFYEEKFIVIDAQDLITREIEGYQFSSRKEFIDV